MCVVIVGVAGFREGAGLWRSGAGWRFCVLGTNYFLLLLVLRVQQGAGEGSLLGWGRVPALALLVVAVASVVACG